jgi:hypothetical protein
MFVGHIFARVFGKSKEDEVECPGLVKVSFNSVKLYCKLLSSSLSGDTDEV